MVALAQIVKHLCGRIFSSFLQIYRNIFLTREKSTDNRCGNFDMALRGFFFRWLTFIFGVWWRSWWWLRVTYHLFLLGLSLLEEVDVVCLSLTVFARKFWLGFFAFKRWRSWFKRQSFTSKCRVFFEFKRRFVRDISWTKLTGSLFVCYFLFVSAPVLYFLTKFVGVAQAAKWIGWRKCRVILTSFYALASHVKFF